MRPSASIVVPTRNRAAYLEVALASIAPQAQAVKAEIVVVDDGGGAGEIAEMAGRFGARCEVHASPLGLNVARNTGVERTAGDLVVFVDDDVEVLDGWLAALLRAAVEHVDVDVFAGHITARFEGPAPRTCGREGPPITSLDLGRDDVEADHAWGANMAIRRRALTRVGPFDASLVNGGDEQEWQERLRAQGGRVLYVARAGVAHRRAGDDARLRALARSARARGSASRRFDSWRGQAPPLRDELLTLAGCIGHVARRRCPAMLVMAAHSVGRTQQAVRERGSPSEHPGPDDFLSGESGTVGGLDRARRSSADGLVGAWRLASGASARLDRAAQGAPQRRVLVVGVRRPQHAALAVAAEAELRRSRHEVDIHTCPPADKGKFENVNALLSAHPAHGHDWLLVIDDDVELGRRFLDRFIFLAERFGLDLAQPAHRANSHAAWRVTRRRLLSVVRETAFVEIGPVTAFRRTTFEAVLPFPDVPMGWGLDAHWAALARARGLRCGVVDAVAIGHASVPAGDGYSREAALAQARAFLATHPYLPARELQRTLATHRRW